MSMTKDDIVERFAALEDRVTYMESQQSWDAGLIAAVKALKDKVAELEACRDGDDGLVKTVERIEQQIAELKAQRPARVAKPPAS